MLVFMVIGMLLAQILSVSGGNHMQSL